MIHTFKIATSGLSAQPSTEKIIIRSSSSADTTQTITASGNVAGVPDTDALTLLGQREVLGAETFQSITSLALSAACAGTLTVMRQGTKAQGRIIVTTNPANNNTLVVGLAGFTTTYTFKTTLTGAANEVLIGATASDTAVNLRRALRDGDAARGDGTGEGTLYGTGTAANTFLDVASISGTILTLEDVIACSRQLAWSFSQSGSGLSLGAPTGGLNGTTIATMTAGVTAKLGAITLNDEALALDLLPPNCTFVSDWFRADGKPFSFILGAENVSSAITASYEVASSTSYPIAGAASLTNLDNNRYVANPTEFAVEYVRLTLVNPNATAASVNAKLAISG
jgi:hypothetical protein